MENMDLKKLAIREAKGLRKHATPEELRRLDATTLDEINNCIYHQMTGLFYSERALELQALATPRTNPAGSIALSPLEKWLLLKDLDVTAKINMVDYLKGSHDTLTPEDL